MNLKLKRRVAQNPCYKHTTIVMDSKDFEEAVKTNGSKDLGFYTKRLEYDEFDLENSLSKNWKAEQKRKNINYGHGILQDLFINPSGSMFKNDSALTKITDRDRLIAATVIQWLGTNCGMCFLNEAMIEAGYKIVKDDTLT